MDITTFALLRTHGASDSSTVDLVIKNDIFIEGAVVIAATKVVDFGGKKFIKATSSTTPAAEEFTITAVADAVTATTGGGSVQVFPGATGHTMFTVTIPDTEPKKVPEVGITAEFTGLGTGSEYNGEWEVLAKNKPAASTWRIVVAKKFNSTITVPSGAKMRVPSIVFSGRIVSSEWWRQLFSGFKPGDIRGSFGGVHEVYPEWWGLTSNHHDVAINSAIKSFIAANPGYAPVPEESLVMGSDGSGRVIALAARRYDISAPLDLSCSLCLLRGAGDGRTSIAATADWDQSSKSWIDCAVWPQVGDPPGWKNHSALVWIGGGFPGSGQSFRTGVTGVDIGCWFATRSAKGKNGTGRVSGISSKGWVEENTIIEDVSISQFSGFGIGFGRRMPYSGNTPIATVNGLTVRKFWLTLGTRRDAYPFYFTFHTAVVTIQDGTIDCRNTDKGLTHQWQEGVAAAGTLQITGYPVDGDKVTIGNKGNETPTALVKTYTFRTTPSASGDVKIVPPADAPSGAGTGYARAMLPHPGVRASYVAAAGGNPARIDLKATAVGASWNRYLLASSDPNGTFGTGSNSAPITTLLNGSETVKATGTFRFTAQPGANARVRMGEKEYTLRASSYTTALVDGDVRIGSSKEDTLKNLAAAIEAKETQETFVNLIKAINGTGAHGTNYFVGTGGEIPHPLVLATAPRATQVLGCPLRHVPRNGDKVTIDGTSLTFRNTLNAASEVVIRELPDSAELPGTSFSAAMSPHPLVRGSLSGSTLTVQARTIGHAGNDITVGLSKASGSTLSWGTAARLASGSPSAFASATLIGTAVGGDIVTMGGRTYVFRDPGVPLTNDGDVRKGTTGAASLANLLAALSGAADTTLDNLRRAINGGTNNGDYTTNPGFPVTASRAGDNALLLTANSCTLDGNDITLSSSVPGGASYPALLAGGPFLEGGSRLTKVVAKAKTAGSTGNDITLNTAAATANDPLPAVWTSNKLVLGQNAPASAPELLIDWPQTGILAQGEHLNINNVHIEGVGIGINVVQSDARSHVTISNVNVWLMNDADQAYAGDRNRVDISVPSLARQKATWPSTSPDFAPHYRKYSCAVLISLPPDSYANDHQNAKDCVTITGLATNSCKFILRDAMYGQEVISFGGQGRNTAAGTIAFYSRGDAYIPAAGDAPYATYAGIYNDDPCAKTYYVGPVVFGPVILGSNVIGPVG